MGIRIPRHSAIRDADADYIFVNVENKAAKTDFTPILFKAPEAGAVTSISFIPQGACTASDSDYLTHGIYNGSTLITTAKTTKTTGGTAMVQGTAINYTVNTTACASGDILSARIVNTGSSGKAFPGGLFVLKFVPSN